jgi:hypothetical protein
MHFRNLFTHTMKEATQLVIKKNFYYSANISIAVGFITVPVYRGHLILPTGILPM